MSKQVRNHLRSNVVGYVAVFLALSMGTAYATHPGGANTISSADIINDEVKADDIKDGTVANAELRANSVTTGKIADGEVKTADVLDNNLTGSDINESTLGKVPDADTLDGTDSTDFARGPGRIQKVDFRANDGTVFASVLDLGGLNLNASCDSSFGEGAKDLRIFWGTDVDNASIGVSYTQFGDGIAHTDYSSDLDTGLTYEGILSMTDDDRTAGILVYTRPDGGSVSVAFQAEDSNGSAGSDALGGTKDCIFTGTATHTP